MTKHQNILTVAGIRQTIQAYFQHHPVDKVCLFGSYAKGLQTLYSDVDLIVFIDKERCPKPQFHQWHTDLKELLGHNVDLLSFKNDYTGSSYRFRQHIHRYMVPLYIRGENC